MNIGRSNLAIRLRTKFGFDNNVSRQYGHKKSWIVKGYVTDANIRHHFPIDGIHP
jgi:hypothetical protein